MKISLLKKEKFGNFQQNKCYIPQKKANNMYNKDSAIKMRIFAKKDFFQFFLSIFSTYSRTPKNFDVQFFKNFEKEVSKIAFLGKVK